MEMFGPDFENFEQVQQKLDEEAEEKERAAVVVVKDGPVDKSKGKKGKLQAKSTGHVYQFQILQSIDIPIADIKLFADPMHWLTHFPPIAVVSLSFYFKLFFKSFV
jgi:leucyl-tRNA synthetase